MENIQKPRPLSHWCCCRPENFPFAASRMVRDLLAVEGVKVDRLHASTLMKKMAIEALEEALARFGAPETEFAAQTAVRECG